MLLIPDLGLDTIAFREAGQRSSFMHSNALNEIVGHSNVQSPVSTACQDVHVESHSCGPGSPLSRGRTERLCLSSLRRFLHDVFPSRAAAIMSPIRATLI